jgi:hypothetical protein
MTYLLCQWANKGGGPTPPPPSEEWLTITAEPGIQTGLSGYTLGCSIVIGGADVVVTHLGRYVRATDTQSHKISVFDSVGAVVGSVIMNTAGLSVGLNYVALANSVTLIHGQTYYLGSLENSDISSINFSTFTTTSVATEQNATYAGSDSYPHLNNGANQMYAGVCFKYSSP